MPAFLLALLHTFTAPDGAGGELLSTRRKFHLLQAEWYIHLAETGERERDNNALPNGTRSAKNENHLIE